MAYFQQGGFCQIWILAGIIAICKICCGSPYKKWILLLNETVMLQTSTVVRVLKNHKCKY